MKKGPRKEPDTFFKLTYGSHEVNAQGAEEIAKKVKQILIFLLVRLTTPVGGQAAAP
jgi:hypothetical protein